MARQFLSRRLYRAAMVGGVAVAAALIAGRATVYAQAATPQVYLSQLSEAHVSAPSGDRIVVTMLASGDLPGLLTVTLDRDPATGTFTQGSWALVVSYAKYLPITGNAPTDDPDAQPLVFVNEGTLGGTFTGATLQLDANGQVVGLTGAQLTLVSGSLQFAGVSGTGSAAASALNDLQHTSGSLSLTF